MTAKKFLQRVPLDEARRLLLSLAACTPAEQVEAEASLGRTTADPVHARFASPHYQASAMDGIAVREADCTTASSDAPVVLTREDTDRAGRAGACLPVDTGNSLPDWADAVIRIEDTEPVDDGYRITAPVAAGKDIRRIGEDVEAGALLFGPGHRIRPYDIGAMLATGVGRIDVRRAPSVAVLATGSELVEPGGNPGPGQVIEFNSRMLCGCVAEWGGRAQYLGRVADDRSAMEQAVRDAAATHDVLCVIAGSSAGSKDYTVDVLDVCGTVHAHGIDVMPGKPASIAEVNGKPVVGIPGYPVSAYAVYRELLGPLVHALLGATSPVPRRIAATVRRRIVSRLGVEELLRVCLAHHDDGLIIAPLPRGAGSVTTLVRADAILRILAGSEGLAENTQIEVELLDTGVAPGTTLVVAGRPDPVSADLATRLRRAGEACRVSYLGRTGYDAEVALDVGEAHLMVLDRRENDDIRMIERLAAGAAELHDVEGGRYTIAATRSAASMPAGRAFIDLL